MIWTPQAMVATVNNLLQPQAQGAWRELSTGEQLRAATMLLDTVEQGAFVLADNLLKTDIVQEKTDNIREYRLHLQKQKCKGRFVLRWGRTLEIPSRRVLRLISHNIEATCLIGPCHAIRTTTDLGMDGGGSLWVSCGTLAEEPLGLVG